MDRKEAIKEAEIQIDVYKSMILYNKDFEPKNDNSNYERKIEFLKVAIAALQEPERKKGQWIILSSNEDSAVCKCSVCGEDFIFYNGEFFPNYCGDCGSDMRGEAE